MPILTVRLSEEELRAAEQAAQQNHLTKSEFARRAIATASLPNKKSASLRGAWKGKTSYAKMMKLLRD